MLWYDKRYHSLNYNLRTRFGEKLIKLCLNAGFTCPNRDGHKGYGGCIFCSAKGSGDFSGDKSASIFEQYTNEKERIGKKWSSQAHNLFIAYFQAFTNTYADIDILEKCYRQALEIADVKVLSIATRPDCIHLEIVQLISCLSKEYGKPIFVELGLQSSKPETVTLINRQYENSEFEAACELLRQYQVEIVCHVILGLPYETKKDMLETVRYACALGIGGIKLQLLYVLKGTALAEMYRNVQFATLSFEEYIDIVVSCLETIPPNIVIHRLTGDGPQRDLIAPLWSLGKKRILNAIDKELKNRDTYQGRARQDSAKQ